MEVKRKTVDNYVFLSVKVDESAGGILSGVTFLALKESFVTIRNSIPVETRGRSIWQRQAITFSLIFVVSESLESINK